MSLLRLENISKEFRLSWTRTSFIKRSEQIFRGQDGPDVRRVLNNVSFEIKEGERWGLIGPNGSGKTTLLKIAAGILRPTSGQIERNVPITSLFTYSLGFADDLSALENIYLAGAVLGMRREKVRHELESIIEFSGLAPHIDVRLRAFSEGMKARLFIAVALHMESQLFIFDEILSVLDQAFQKKCSQTLMDLSKKGCGMIFITHEGGILQKITEQCLLLEGGAIAGSGPTSSVLSQYKAQL